MLDAGVRPDLIISDVMMPGISGPELVQHLSARPALAHVPVILTSAYSGCSCIGKTAAFVSKPYALDALCNLVDELLVEPDPPANSTREPRLLTHFGRA